jgi:hypothetical protein
MNVIQQLVAEQKEKLEWSACDREAQKSACLCIIATAACNGQLDQNAVNELRESLGTVLSQEELEELYHVASTTRDNLELISQENELVFNAETARSAFVEFRDSYRDKLKELGQSARVAESELTRLREAHSQLGDAKRRHPELLEFVRSYQTTAPAEPALKRESKARRAKAT